LQASPRPPPPQRSKPSPGNTRPGTPPLGGNPTSKTGLLFDRTCDSPISPEFRRPKAPETTDFRACSNPQNDKRARFALRQKAGTEIIPNTTEKIPPG